AAFGYPVIASGGVASVADIERLAPVAHCIEGVITGRAIYEGTLGVAEGVAACKLA
ncbi:MAG: 1-(5-phosphoribosyl)-5-((5-phosphoribosylamino)methylideneamino)imidazole-4-carboxamide isomerase, partial [Eggerthellaceae bacterium]|nr:1-(5-phosphoribosyl)-5-((5-phosphoribosylamino)methylideneamino)imidazole-4-carboxamide isomerase [Eggerthellaceae bacterium]